MSAQLTSLGAFRYVCPIETAQSWGALKTYLGRRRYVLSHVALLCVRHDVAIALKSHSVPVAIFSIEEIPEFRLAIEKARQRVTQWEQPLMDRAYLNPFLWSILMSLHGEYLLQAAVGHALARALITHTIDQHVWILTPVSHFYRYNAALFGARNPLLVTLLAAMLQTVGRRYELTTGFWRIYPATLVVVEYLRLVTNIILLAVTLPLNFLLGVSQGIVRKAAYKPAKTIIAFFRETASFEAMEKLPAQLRTAGFRLVQVDFENLRWEGKWRLWPLLIKKLLGALNPFGSRRTLLRLDPRSPASAWIIWFVMPSTAVRALWESITRGPKQCREVEQVLDELVWPQLPGVPDGVRRYTALLLRGFFIEYLYAKLFWETLQRQVTPSTVIYPDGYSILVQLLHYSSRRGMIHGVQVPHGYPNRRFPRYYYEARAFIAPTLLTKWQLQSHGIEAARIIAVANNRLPEHRPAGIPRKEPLIALIYTGSYGYWSFPNHFLELAEKTRSFVSQLFAAMPAVQLILKSHPNGTSFDLFSGLLKDFPTLVERGRLQHVASNWPPGKGLSDLTAAISLHSFPSTPFIDCVRSNTPLAVVRGYHPDSIYEPSFGNFSGYPFIMDTTAAAVEWVTLLLKTSENSASARQAMRQYAATLVDASAPPFVNYLLHSEHHA